MFFTLVNGIKKIPNEPNKRGFRTKRNKTNLVG